MIVFHPSNSTFKAIFDILYLITLNESNFMNANSLFWRQLFPSQSSAVRQIYERNKKQQILEFHDSSFFRHSLSLHSHMQRYEELNKVGEGMCLLAGDIN